MEYSEEGLKDSLKNIGRNISFSFKKNFGLLKQSHKSLFATIDRDLDYLKQSINKINSSDNDKKTIKFPKNFNNINKPKSIKEINESIHSFISYINTNIYENSLSMEEAVNFLQTSEEALFDISTRNIDLEEAKELVKEEFDYLNKNIFKIRTIEQTENKFLGGLVIKKTTTKDKKTIVDIDLIELEDFNIVVSKEEFISFIKDFTSKIENLFLLKKKIESTFSNIEEKLNDFPEFDLEKITIDSESLKLVKEAGADKLIVIMNIINSDVSCYLKESIILFKTCEKLIVVSKDIINNYLKKETKDLGLENYILDELIPPTEKELSKESIHELINLEYEEKLLTKTFESFSNTKKFLETSIASGNYSKDILNLANEQFLSDVQWIHPDITIPKLGLESNTIADDYKYTIEGIGSFLKSTGSLIASLFVKSFQLMKKIYFVFFNSIEREYKLIPELIKKVQNSNLDKVSLKAHGVFNIANDPKIDFAEIINSSRKLMDKLIKDNLNNFENRFEDFAVIENISAEIYEDIKSDSDMELKRRLPYLEEDVESLLSKRKTEDSKEDYLNNTSIIIYRGNDKKSTIDVTYEKGKSLELIIRKEELINYLEDLIEGIRVIINSKKSIGKGLKRMEGSLKRMPEYGEYDTEGKDIDFLEDIYKNLNILRSDFHCFIKETSYLMSIFKEVVIQSDKLTHQFLKQNKYSEESHPFGNIFTEFVEQQGGLPKAKFTQEGIISWVKDQLFIDIKTKPNNFKTESKKIKKSKRWDNIQPISIDDIEEIEYKKPLIDYNFSFPGSYTDSIDSWHGAKAIADQQLIIPTYESQIKMEIKESLNIKDIPSKCFSLNHLNSKLGIFIPVIINQNEFLGYVIAKDKTYDDDIYYYNKTSKTLFNTKMIVTEII